MAELENKNEAEESGKSVDAAAEKKAKKSKKDKVSFGAKISKFFRDYKSELKKVVWYGRKATINSTILVVVCLVIASAVICLLDFGFSKAIIALGEVL